MKSTSLDVKLHFELALPITGEELTAAILCAFASPDFPAGKCTVMPPEMRNAFATVPHHDAPKPLGASGVRLRAVEDP